MKASRNGMNEGQGKALEGPGILICPSGQKFNSSRQVGNLIQYITRTREKEQHRDDLISYGARGVEINRGTEIAIRQMKQVQSVYQRRNGSSRLCYHEYYSLREEYDSLLDDDAMDELAYQLCDEYWKKGYQVVYAVHRKAGCEHGRHIHFALNTVNVKDGKKWHDWFDTKRERNERFNEKAMSIILQERAKS